MKTLSLFSGVGGLDAAVSHALGCEIVAHCEADAYCRKVLARHWPAVPCFDDVQTLTAEQVGAIDCICGGFPCTDLSVAGKQAGINAEKSGLWWHYLRLVRELRPAVVVIENVPPLYRTPAWREAVEGSLDALDYGVAWTLCTASDVGAPHRRERCFALAVRRDCPWPKFVGTVARAEQSDPGDAHWPTMTTQAASDSGTPSEMRRNTPNLAATVRMVGDWPTPVAGDSKSAGSRCLPGSNAHPSESLTDAVRPDRAKKADKWTPPTASDCFGAGRAGNLEGGDNLRTQVVQVWQTPCAHEARLGYQHRHAGAKGTQISLTTQVVDDAGGPKPTRGVAGGTLSADWVERLMGVPTGFTACDGPPQTIDFAPDWPAGRVPGLDGASPQYDWEPPRLVLPKSVPNRNKRLKALGNAVVPQQAVLALSRLCAMQPTRREAAVNRLAQAGRHLRAAPRTVRVVPTQTDVAAQPVRWFAFGVPSAFRWCLCGELTTGWTCARCRAKGER